MNGNLNRDSELAGIGIYMNRLIGKFAVSAAGHDKGKMYVIVACEGENRAEYEHCGSVSSVPAEKIVYMCDGKCHTWNKPKRKSVKHINILKEGVPQEMMGRIMAREKIFDHEIKYVIKLQQSGKEDGYVKE